MFHLSRPLFHPSPPDRDGANSGGSDLPPRGPDRVRPLVDVLHGVMHESIRDFIKVYYTNALPVLCTAEPALNLLWPRSKTEACIGSHGGKLVVPPALLPGEIKTEQGLQSFVLSRLGAISMAEKGKNGATSLAPLDLQLLDLNQVSKQLALIQGELQRRTPQIFTHDSAGAQSVYQVAQQLKEETSRDKIALLVGYRMLRLIPINETTHADLIVCLGRESPGGFTLRQAQWSLAFEMTVAAINEAILQGIVRSDGVQLLSPEEIVRLVPPEKNFEIPETTRLLLVPLCHGDASFGMMAITFSLPQADFILPEEVLRDCELLSFSGGAAISRLDRLEATDAVLPNSALRSHTAPDPAVTQRSELIILSDVGNFSHARSVCRRVMLASGDQRAVVFISDRNSSGRSIVNTFELLAKATLPDIEDVPMSQIRWFQFLTGEIPPQSRTFDEVLGCATPGSTLRWVRAQDDFAQAVANILKIDQDAHTQP